MAEVNTMKMTDRELNNIVDDVTAEIRSEKLDSATVESAAQRVWTRMTGERPRRRRRQAGRTDSQLR